MKQQKNRHLQGKMYLEALKYVLLYKVCYLITQKWTITSPGSEDMEEKLDSLAVNNPSAQSCK